MEEWSEMMIREAHRKLPPKVSIAYFDLLEERGYLERDPKYVKLTKAFV